jgi:hypothetical protein
MLKKILLFLLFIGVLKADDVNDYLVTKKIPDSFITKYEYGKMLYHNPRGISCAKCHGDDAKGMKISRFKHKIKTSIYNCVVESHDITNISFEKFKAKLDPDIKVKKIEFEKNQVCEKLIYGNTMPKYFLTEDELESIYYYISNIRK